MNWLFVQLALGLAALPAVDVDGALHISCPPFQNHCEMSVSSTDKSLHICFDDKAWFGRSRTRLDNQTEMQFVKEPCDVYAGAVFLGERPIYRGYALYYVYDKNFDFSGEIRITRNTARGVYRLFEGETVNASSFSSSAEWQVSGVLDVLQLSRRAGWGHVFSHRDYVATATSGEAHRVSMPVDLAEDPGSAQLLGVLLGLYIRTR